MADNELTNIQNDALTSSILNKQGINLQLPFSRNILLMNTMINGAMHVDTIYEQARALKQGDHLTLRLEPKNKYDEKAILVLDPEGNKLGYIPRIKNEVLYHLMDAGKELFGIVRDGDIGDNVDEEDVWIEIFIDVYMCD